MPTLLQVLYLPYNKILFRNHYARPFSILRLFYYIFRTMIQSNRHLFHLPILNFSVFDCIYCISTAIVFQDNKNKVPDKYKFYLFHLALFFYILPDQLLYYIFKIIKQINVCLYNFITMCFYNLTIIIMRKLVSHFQHFHPVIIRDQICLISFP